MNGNEGRRGRAVTGISNLGGGLLSPLPKLTVLRPCECAAGPVAVATPRLRRMGPQSLKIEGVGGARTVWRAAAGRRLPPVHGDRGIRCGGD